MRLKFGLAIVPQLAIADQVRLGVLAENLGFDSCWWPDHLAYPDQAAAIDCWTVMAAVASHTRRIHLGTAVSDCHRLHPAVFAQRAATLDQLSCGRLMMGLGSGEAMNLQPFGLPWQDRKVARLREFIQVLRGLLQGGSLDFQGDFYRLSRAKLSVTPYRGRHIPLHLACLGPQMQRLGGEWADGWKPVVIPAAHYGQFFAGLAQSAQDHGRPLDCIERGVPLVLALFPGGRLPQPQQLAQVVRPFAGPLVWEAAVRAMGLPFEPPERLRGVGYHTVNPYDPDSCQLFQEYCRWVPDDLLRQMVVCGSPTQVRQAFADYIEAGVNHFEIINASPDPLASLVWLAREIIPYFSGRKAGLGLRCLHTVLQPLSRLGLTRRWLPPGLDLWRPVGL